ncbi:MAG: putative molybdenum carrier protein [Scytonematopsis contorta HA4267-MV1]|jgi:DNA-binding transcriptional MerR regulator|nr:putative molybdenum carrier protein [Scytonematopsis contorta HA4267-MV1]
MAIEAKHFDTRLNQWIHTDNDTNNPETLLKEELNNSLLEHFLPGKQFSFGHMDDKTKPEMLFNHPDGDVLLLSSKSRLLYGSQECLETIQKLCPDNKDRGAYGSIFLGSCQNAVTKELNILIVDDCSGENGEIINNKQAYRLTGDCYGQVSTELYHELTKHQEGDSYRVIQHRFGWTDQDGDDNKFRFGKGTLRPANLDQILNYQNSNQPKVDLILPLSAFKGTDKDNPNEPTKPQIKPGLYKQNIWLGEKSQSELGKTAISQMIASFPNGVKDFTEQIELEAKKLHAALDDPRKIAQIYCQKYEKRKQFLETQAQELEEEAIENPQLGDELEKLRSRIATDTNIYKLIKTDLEGSGQLLETEKVQQELARFVQNEWKEIAIGKSLTFERAMVIPSKDLQNGEISIPHYQDGEEVLNFRSPFLNSNGLCVSTNKVVEDITGPDGKPLAGVIAVSDETSERIYNRLSEQVQSIIPEARGNNLKLEGIENYLDQNIGKLETKEKIEFTNKFNEYIKELQSAGYSLKILPQESEQERQGRDYDGDCIGFEQASKYPNLTAEAIERNLPENAYDPTVKLKKQSFYREDGSQPEFEEIAIHMSDGISVGVINNHLTSIEALESEITILKNFGSEKDQVEYVQQVAKHYEELFQTENWAANRGIQGKEIPDKYRGYMSEFVQTARQEPLTQANILASLGTNTQMYREMIAEAAFQNQIAVDLFKSAKKPEMGIIRSNSRILHREVNYIKDKKKDVYVNSTIKPTGYSPVELLIAKTNQYFDKASLESRDLVEFSKLFNGIEFSNQQKLEATLAKKDFDILFNAASRASSQKKVEPGLSANIKLPNGNNLIVTNLLRYDNESIWNSNHINNIKIKIVATDPEKHTKERPHEYLVYAQINEEKGNNGEPKFQPIGTLAQSQEKLLDKLGIDYGKPIQGGKITFQPEISESQIDLLFKQAYQKAEDFYKSVPIDEKLQMAAAAWSVATTRESSESATKKISNFAFAAFSKEIIDRQKELQFTEFTLTGHKYNDTSEVLKPENVGSPQETRFNIAKQTNSKGITEIKGVIEFKNSQGEYQTFGNINALDAKLPIGTTTNGTFEIDEASTATVTTKVPGLPEITFKVSDLQKFNHNNRYDNASIMMTVENTKIVREEYSIYIKEGSKDVKLGVLDDKSIKDGVASGWLKEKTDTGQALQLKFQSVTTGNNAYAIAENSNGDLMRVNITNETYKRKSLNDSEFRPAKVTAYDKKYVYVAKIGDQTLGIIGQHTERLLAEISKGKCLNTNNKYKQKPSTPQILIDNKILKENQNKTTIPVQLTTNETTCTLRIDPETVKYPDKWVKRSHLIDNNKSEISETEQRAKQIFDKIGERPTLMFQNKEMVSTNKVGLVIDEKLVDKTQQYLDKQNIKYEQLPKLQSKLETKKGMVVFVIDESTITPETKNIFIERAGGNIKNEDEYKAALVKIPNRSKILSKEDIPVLITLAKPSQDEELPQNTNIPEAPKNYEFDKVSNATDILQSPAISLPSSQEANSNKSIEILGKINSEKVEQLRSHLEAHFKPLLENDKSSYAPDRQVAWVGAKWDLKEKHFKPGVQDNKLMELVKQVYPDADIALVTYSENRGAGINYHRDDSYAAIEARSINIGNSEWGYRAAKEKMMWTREENSNANYQEFKLESGTVTRFNCKNEHAAINTEAGRWSINIWSVKNDLGKENSVCQKFENFTASNQPPRAVVQSNNDLTIKANEWTPGGGIKVERSFKSLTLKNLLETYKPSENKNEQPKITPIISPNSNDGLGAALALDTVKAKENGFLQSDYPIEFLGKQYTDTKQACIDQIKLQPQADVMQVMTSVIQAKLEQHPRLTKEITKRGGVEWLNSCEAVDNSNTPGWDGIGKESALIKAITQAYTNVIEKQNNLQVPTDPSPQSKIKVISGGQTGADIGGLIGAKALGLATSGIAAAGWMTENGANPKLQDYGLIEGEKGASMKETYAKRTIANIKESDGTIILGNINSVGSKLTVNVAREHNKPTLAIPLETVFTDKVAAAKLIEDFVRDNNIQTLNVAGNRESVAPGLQAATAEIVLRGLAPIIEKNAIIVNDTHKAQTPTNSVNTPQQLETEPGINITSRSDDPFGAVLTATTCKSKQAGTIEGDYPVYYRDNKPMPAGQQGPEFYGEAKPAGQPFLSAQQAFYAYKEEYKPGEPMVKLMTDILQARLEQHPDIVNEVTARGGMDWLKKCSYTVTTIDPENPEKKASFWEGEGLKSPYIRALATAYIKVIELDQVSTAQKNLQQPQSNNLNGLDSSPLPTHIPSTPINNHSISEFTDDEQQVYERNDQLENAFNSTKNGKTQVGAMDSIIDKMKANTIQTLQDWHVAAQQLGKSERYLNRIQEVTQDYIYKNISLDRAFTAMDKDTKALEKVNEITALAHKISQTFGKTDVNGITSVQTESYKNYKIATKNQDNTYLIKDKDDNVLLYVKQGKTQVSNLNDDVVRDFRFIDFKINESLKNTRKELVEK